mgnify:CR=1 FL=1
MNFPAQVANCKLLGEQAAYSIDLKITCLMVTREWDLTKWLLNAEFTQQKDINSNSKDHKVKLLWTTQIINTTPSLSSERFSIIY